jgi:T5SS/PEP-CTERM-associated repeat protein
MGACLAGYLYKWRLTTGGDGGLAANWSPYTDGSPGSTPPGSADEADFTGLGGTIVGTITVDQWVIGGSAGYYTFAGKTTATYFQAGASAALTGTWTQAGAGDIDITAGTFTMRSGATLVSQATGSTALGLVVDGALLASGAAITAASGIAIGYDSTGSLSESGGTLSAAAIDLAVNAGASGTLDLLSGAVASVSGIVAVGEAAGGSGSVIDINAGTLMAQGQVQVGPRSAGTLIIQNGGLLSTTASLSYPFLAVGGTGGTGSVVIEDTGSQLNAAANQIEIGSGGSGALTVEGGARLVAGGLFVATGGGTGTVSATGAGTSITIGTGGLSIGDGGTGLVILRQGARLTAADRLDAGVGSAGTFDIGSTATLTSQGAGLGLLSSSDVSGSGSVSLDAAQWLSSGQITVGDGAGGSANLQLSAGATLQATATLAPAIPFLYVDETIAGHATVDVGGKATVLDAGGNAAVIGAAGFGALTVHDGAQVDVGNSGTGAAFVLGELSGSDGTAALTGAGTRMNVTGGAVIGGSGAGTLAVGGTFDVSGDMNVALNASAGGTVNVGGGDLAIAGQLVIGGGSAAGGTGAVTVASGGLLTADNLTLFSRGSLTVDSTGSAEIGSAGDAIAGQLVVDTGVTTGGSGEVAAAVTNHGDLVAQDGTLTITGKAAGDGVYDITAGATLALDQPGDVRIRFDATTGAAFFGTASGTVSPLQFSGTDTLFLDGVGADAKASYAGDTVTVAGSGGTWTLNFAAPPPGLQITTSGNQAEVVACFAAGTLIATPAGEVPVERLSAGDRVKTLSGQARPIAWIGTGRVLATRGRRNAATPVVLHKGALGPNMPHHTLRVTKGHSFFIDGVLIPAEFLVNNRSIEWDDRAQEVTIYHIELETHDVLLANGAPAESYRDDGNRWLFQNANSARDLQARPACAPVLTGGPIVDRVWRRLLERAGRRPGLPLTDDPDLHLVVDGKRVDAMSRHGIARVFRLPAAPSCVRVVSRAAVPAELGVARDFRILGVALRQVALRQGTWFRVLEASDEALAEGFHAFEPDGRLRWTNGDAALPMALFAGRAGALELVLHVACTTQYPSIVEPSRAAAA